MNTLILDCSAGMNIYLIAAEKLYSKIDSNQKKHTDELLLALDELVKEAGINIKQIDNICVCVGPGSFTGIRVAVSICKGLAIGTGAKIFTCSNFDLFSFGDSKKAYYLLEGFSDYVYVREFDGEISHDSCEHFEEFANNIKPNYIVVTNSEKLQNQLKKSGIPYKNAENKTKLVFEEKIKNNDFTKISDINPIYLRASQAEIEREKKLNGK